MAGGRPHGRSKSHHRVCQAARYARAAEYREKITISAEQQEARIAAVNAECNVEDAPRRRRRQKSRESKTKAGAARVSAGGRSRKASGSAKKKAKKGLEHALGKAAERDPHALHCDQCGATAEFGLRGGKEGGKVKFVCRGHVHSTGCCRIDRDRADWAEDREMRRLRAEERRLEEELRNLRGASFTAKPPYASEKSQSAGSGASMPMSRSLLATLLLIGGIERNPGPAADKGNAALQGRISSGWNAAEGSVVKSGWPPYLLPSLEALNPPRLVTSWNWRVSHEGGLDPLAGLPERADKGGQSRRLHLRLRGGADDDPMDQEIKTKVIIWRTSDVNARPVAEEDGTSKVIRLLPASAPEEAQRHRLLEQFSKEETIFLYDGTLRSGGAPIFTEVKWTEALEGFGVFERLEKRPQIKVYSAADRRGQDAGANQIKDVEMQDAEHGNQNREGAPQELVDFWRALPDAAWSDDGKVMTLADGTSFLGHEGLGNKLYLRDCYPALQKEVEDLFAEDSHQRKKNRAVVIIGNPGIGKSLFGYLLLYQWATEDPPRDVVVVKRGYCPTATLLSTAGCFELDKKALAEQLRRPEVRYLVDGLNPMDVGRLPTRAQMVLVTSPNPDIYHEAWKSVGYRHRYMDVWSREEVDECREGVFPDLDPDEVQARYDRWGGIPRYVLEKVDSDAQRLLEKAITSTPLKALQESVGEQAAPSETSHKMLHLRVGADFETTCMEMASTYVAERVAYQLWRNEKESLRLFLSSSEGEGSVGALRGNLWEGFCHARLIEGGPFKIRDLSDPLKRVEERQLPGSSSGQALAPLIFDNWKDIQGMPHGRYLRPRSKTNESVDSGMQPNILFQITVSKRHDLKPGGMKRALEFLEQNGPGAVELHFALPSDAFMRFSRAEIKPAAVNNAVKQFALEVSF